VNCQDFLWSLFCDRGRGSSVEDESECSAELGSLVCMLIAAHGAVAFEVVVYAQSEAGKARCASVPQQPLQPSSNNRPVGIEIVTM
jgi:hypothetical protein